MMNRLLKTRCTFPVLLMLSFLSIVTSCDKEWPDDLCDCDKGNTIGGWEDANDTTVVSKNDTIGGFSISVDEWGNISQQDIPL